MLCVAPTPRRDAHHAHRPHHRIPMCLMTLWYSERPVPTRGRQHHSGPTAHLPQPTAAPGSLPHPIQPCSSTHAPWLHHINSPLPSSDDAAGIGTQSTAPPSESAVQCPPRQAQSSPPAAHGHTMGKCSIAPALRPHQVNGPPSTNCTQPGDAQRHHPSAQCNLNVHPMGPRLTTCGPRLHLAHRPLCTTSLQHTCATATPPQRPATDDATCCHV